MTGSRADGHDLDKLERWRSGLGNRGDFPVHAVFLVSEADTLAHGAFRAFRSSFEARGGSFQHLVIFGQHGVSTTAATLAKELGVQGPPPPAMALLYGCQPSRAYVMALPSGGGSDSSAWTRALLAVEAWIDGGAEGLDAEALPWAQQVETRHDTVAGLAEGVAARLATGGGRG
ncbi:MAG: hypothetical protein J4F43_07160 [Dehalococcoidia bacterium]|nr:hypothetical protein [Dehalococcoidia bacterium]